MDGRPPEIAALDASRRVGWARALAAEEQIRQLSDAAPMPVWSVTEHLPTSGGMIHYRIEVGAPSSGVYIHATEEVSDAAGEFLGGGAVDLHLDHKAVDKLIAALLDAKRYHRQRWPA